MKTLDEVIKAMLICKNEDIDRTCKGCPMPDTEMCINELMTDALHYLKEYQKILSLLPSLIGTALEAQKKGKTRG